MPPGIKDIIFKNLADNLAWVEIEKQWDKLSDLYDKKEWESIYNILSDIRANFRKPNKRNIFLDRGK